MEEVKAKPTLTVCMAVINEEAVIERCFKSIQGVYDKLLVAHDGPCLDKTLEIAKRYGAKTFIRPRQGSAEKHRAFLYQQVTTDWVLFIDPDEFLTPKLKKAIPKLIQDTNVDAYGFNWPTWDGKKYINGPYATQERIALLRTSKMYYRGLTHEAPKTSGVLKHRMDLMIEHQPNYNRYSFSNFRKKWLNWSELQARETLHYKEAPTFHMDDENAPYVKLWNTYYESIIAHPYRALIWRYIIKACIKMVLKRGLLKYPSPTTLKIMLMEYINVIYFAHMISYYKKLEKRKHINVLLVKTV